MIYLIDEYDPTMFEMPEKPNSLFRFYEVPEERVKKLIQNSRTRTMLGKSYVTNLFNITTKVQMTDVKIMKLKLHDKVILWKDDRYFIMQVLSYERWYTKWKKEYLS